MKNYKMKRFGMIMALCTLALLLCICIPVGNALCHASANQSVLTGFVLLSAMSQMFVNPLTLGISATVQPFDRVGALMNALQNIETTAPDGTTETVSYRPGWSTLRNDGLLSSTSIPTINFKPGSEFVQNGVAHCLRLSDCFIPVMWRIGIRKMLGGTTQSNSADATSQIYNWPNPTIFSGTNEAINLFEVFNCYAEVKMGSTLVSEFMHTSEFLDIGIAQQGLVVSQLGTPVTPQAYQGDEHRGPDWGYAKYPSLQCFNGLLAPSVAFTTVGGNTFAGTSTLNYVVVFFKGILIPNSSKDIVDAVLNNFSTVTPA